MTRRYWVGVVSAEHVRKAVEGGFCQLNHGKEAPLRRLQPGDRILYYSSRETMQSGEPLQAFTAIGEVLDEEPYAVAVTKDFHPFRRNVRYFSAEPAPIRPLLPHLSFSRGNAAWGQVLRRGTFEIEESDYKLILKAMRAQETKR
jgi:hypothetical protein